jgi:NAD(P)-dependent dehydrogenase (short-subunit alcohol dehydrogenase family)
MFFEDLKNKVVIITGGLGFLGLQHIDAFHKCGSKIIVLDKNENKKTIYDLQKKFKFKFYKTDITNEKKIKAVSKKIYKDFKKIDVLINNAANNYFPKKLIKINDGFNIKNCNLDIEVGLIGSIICTKIFGSLMSLQKSGGNIINISSDLGIISPDQRIYKGLNFIKPVSYSIVKHGIIGLTKYTSTYWSNKNIRCNALALGGMYNNQDKKFVQKIKKLIPLNRMAKKNEYQGCLLFLSSNSSSYMTGSTLVIDGGRHVW